MPPRRKRKEPERKLSLSDKQQAECVAAAATEIIAYLKEATEENKTRQIRQLGKHEIDALATVVIGAYVAVRAKQEEEERLERLLADEFNDPIDDLFLA